MITIQIIGVAIGLAAIHLTYLYYKRANFTKKEVLFWCFVWLAFIIVTIFPRLTQPVVGYFGLQRSMDLIMIIAFIILFALAFHNYIVNHRVEQRIDQLVRSIAMKQLNDKKEQS